MTVFSNVFVCESNNTSLDGSYREIMQDLVPGWIFALEYMPWLWAMFGSILVGLSGVLPLLVIPIDHTDNLKQGDGANKLKTLLSFAVGGLLGDVFLHSLPEIWANDVANNESPLKIPIVKSGETFGSMGCDQLQRRLRNASEDHHYPRNGSDRSSRNTNNRNRNQYMDGPRNTDSGSVPHPRTTSDGHTSTSGILILTGLIVFVFAEKLFTVIEKVGKRQQERENTAENNNVKGLNEENRSSAVTGYLNLVANTIDNFTHGLSLGGAFLVSLRLGLFTTFAILVHEIPHEVGDFAILLKSGFTRWHAATFQLLTAGGGLVGALSAITFSGAKNSMEARTSWILPFTAGTFLHIALVTVLPDLLKEEDPKESLKQLFALIFGITLMACVTNAFE